ncbi:hypothetical protein KAFR_0G03720 [Kazachstania africana CBS 2517]|uniref:WW domain-containing protein n=1 Tax=Kazachstania africana (strain ATCC 22294 / BCRC 22015 / CBS 2517 / CECT 1963 / NBRC 1671 / NRRL Y-8276) TaxID=1071382 RepID=H2AYF5_KAZAF|nr:hypothetical protein KAFR_0G03720 [Kazachstania africana CBS 2517]CCF59405.1 hypothetical protein KAFR_0G03720 [Kazachstania africana CBS 2517]
MNKIWKEYRAPNGKKYYYNTETKKTTWEKPEAAKREEIEPVFVIRLMNDWKLVICNNGMKYYLDNENEPTKELSDEESLRLIELFDKEKLVCLIGIARGYAIENVEKIYGNIVEEVEFLKEDMKNEQERLKKEAESEVREIVLKEAEKPRMNLVEGYDSSESEEEEEEEDDYEFLNNVADEGLSGDKAKFMELFDRYGLDKFSEWSMEMNKVSKDPDFYLVTDDQEREDLFERWCSGQGIHSTSDEEAKEGGEPEEHEERPLEPTKFHYLSQIVSKSEIRRTTIFQDIKRQNKRLFKEYKIKDFIESSKEQEKFVSKLLFYYKTFPQVEDRTKQFNDFLREKNANYTSMSDMNTLSEHIKRNDTYAIETTLLQIECNFPQDVLSDVRYYILDLKQKTIELVKNSHVNEK